MKKKHLDIHKLSFGKFERIEGRKQIKALRGLSVYPYHPRLVRAIREGLRKGYSFELMRLMYEKKLVGHLLFRTDGKKVIQVSHEIGFWFDRNDRLEAVDKANGISMQRYRERGFDEMLYHNLCKDGADRLPEIFGVEMKSTGKKTIRMRKYKFLTPLLRFTEPVLGWLYVRLAKRSRNIRIEELYDGRKKLR